MLAVAGGRCPQCGAEQPSDSAVTTTRAPEPLLSVPVRPSRAAPVRIPQKPVNKAIPWVVLGVGLTAILFLGAVLSPRQKDEAKLAAPSADEPAAASSAHEAKDPNDLGIANVAAVDPTDLLARAKMKALAWNRDALLVSMRASGVQDGKVSLPAGGTVDYWFGKPTGEGFGSGARVSGKRLHVAVSSAGTTVEEVPGGIARAALEPNCPLDDAARKARAAGLPTSAPLSVVYDFNDKHKKAVFRITAGDDALTRVLDGWTCAILVR